MENKTTITINGKKLPYYPRHLSINDSTPCLDISVVIENLNIFKEIADRYKLPVILIYGTLLGAIRENSFIKHDTDTDLVIDIKYENKLLEMIPELEKAGLLFIRYYKYTIFNKGSIIYSFMRNEMWIDVYLMQKHFNSYLIEGFKYPKNYFCRFDLLSFYGQEYLIPYNSEKLLALIYGNDWRIPKINFHPHQKNIIYFKIYRFLLRYLRHLLKLHFIKNIINKINLYFKVVVYIDK